MVDKCYTSWSIWIYEIERLYDDHMNSVYTASTKKHNSSINKYQQKELKLKTYEYYEMDQDDQLMTSYQFNMLPWYVEIEVNYMNIWFVCIIAATTKMLTTMFFSCFFLIPHILYVNDVIYI